LFWPGRGQDLGDDDDDGVATNQFAIIDPKFHSKEVVLDFGASTVSGKGNAMANTEIIQDRAYFEATVQGEGALASSYFEVGMARRQPKIVQRAVPGQGDGAWVLPSTALPDVKTGDVIGCAYDQTEQKFVKFFVNGVEVDDLTSKMKASPVKITGEVSPVVHVDGNILSLNYGRLPFKHPVPRYDGVVAAIDMLRQ
jgi:hypothetical protein